MKSPLLPLLVGSVLLAGGCFRPNPEERKAEMIDADIAFSAKSALDGALAAFLAYVAPNAKLLGEDATGADAVRVRYGSFPAGARLTWRPRFAEMGAGGELGYTWGSYELRTPSPNGGKPAVRTGTYVTIWKRQSDEAWKFVLDAGNPDPLPASPKP